MENPEINHEILDLRTRDARVWNCEQSLLVFAVYYFYDRISNEFGDFQVEALFELEALQAGETVLKLWPREHAKTTLISLVYVVWNIVYRKSRNIVIFSDTADQANEFLRNVKQELENNVSIIRDFGDLVGDSDRNGGVWNVKHIITANRVQVKAKASKGQTRGLNVALPKVVFWAGPNCVDDDPATADFIPCEDWEKYFRLHGGYFVSKKRENVRPDLVILDDILKDEHVKNEDIREKMRRWFWQPLWNAVDHANGRIILVGTILHEDDLLNSLMEDVEQTVGWKKSRMPACEGFEPEVVLEDFTPTEGPYAGKTLLRVGQTRQKPVNPLWPSRWGAVNPYTGQYVLWERRRQIGELIFTIEFLLEPIDDSVRIIRRGWLRHYVPNDMLLPSGMIKNIESTLGYPLVMLPDDLIVNTAVDPAISEKEKADNTVVSTMGYSPSTNKFYLLEITIRRMSVQETVFELIRHVQKWNSMFGGMARDKSGNVIDKGAPYIHTGVVIEVNAYQKALYEAFKMMSEYINFRIKIIQRQETRDKRYRFMRMQPYFEAGDVYFPLDMVSGQERPEVTEAINELVNIGVAAHDDCPDAMERNMSALSRFAIYSGYGLDPAKFVETMIKENPTEFG